MTEGCAEIRANGVSVVDNDKEVKGLAYVGVDENGGAV